MANKITKSYNEARKFVKDKTGDKTGLMTKLGYVAIFLFILLSSFVTIGFNPDKLTETAFWVMLAVKIGITGAILIVSIADGKHNLKRDKLSDYSRALRESENSVEEIYKRNLVVFYPEYNDVRFEREKADFIKNRLHEVGLVKDRILELGEAELFNLLLEPLVGNLPDGTPFTHDVITKQQLKVILKIKSGKITLHKFDVGFFISKSEDSNYSFQYKSKVNRKRIETQGSLIKFAMVAMITILIATIIPDALNGDIWAAIIAIAGHLVTSVSAIITGYGVANDSIGVLTGLNRFKEESNKTFIIELDLGTFVPSKDADILETLLKTTVEAAEEIIEAPEEQNPEVIEIVAKSNTIELSEEEQELINDIRKARNFEN